MSSDGSSSTELLFRAIPAQFQLLAEEKRTLKQYARTLSSRLTSGRGFTCLLTNDIEVRALNSRFLNRDYATDVLSFPSHDDDGHLGELAISVERAASQAIEFSHSLVEEIRILTLHGVLHLMGMDHESDAGEMAAAERKWRIELDLPSTLIARASVEAARR
ncbi:MAG: rRNA maturation RNase YbeY [Acidobacteriaceae bacterium]|nr:rRNA maturation RNase YbeY [Acidobacteriaceae bacterium]MBV9501232.1 rRNA maturation RNase YbeY [Acidobacteriaceae bacterium]